MSRRLISVLVVLSVLSIIGILTVQIVWVRNAYALRERQFRQTAFIALQQVAGRVATLNHIVLNRYAVTQLASDYFIVNTDSPIDPVTLEHYIQTSLRAHNLITDFEYGIYDCENNRMVYGAYVSTQATEQAPVQQTLPTFSRYTYYFGIRFPGQSGFIREQLDGWILSSVIVLIVVIFFGYTLVVVLRQRRLTDLQRDFINSITHELQTPVSTIRIAADVLRSDAILTQPERLRQYARVVHEESGRLQQQIQNVLQVASATHGRTEQTSFSLNLTAIDLHQLLVDVAASYQSPLTLTLRAETTLIQADRYHLTNVLHNLIDNALKYTRDEPRLTLSTCTEGNRLIWSVQDNGIGIGPTHHKRIFRQFYRVPTDETPSVAGFGLGLYYVHQVVRAHGWQIRVTSVPGQGSCFAIDCPLPASASVSRDAPVHTP